MRAFDKSVVKKGAILFSRIKRGDETNLLRIALLIGFLSLVCVIQPAITIPDAQILESRNGFSHIQVRPGHCFEALQRLKSEKGRGLWRIIPLRGGYTFGQSSEISFPTRGPMSLAAAERERAGQRGQGAFGDTSSATGLFGATASPGTAGQNPSWGLPPSATPSAFGSGGGPASGAFSGGGTGAAAGGGSAFAGAFGNTAFGGGSSVGSAFGSGGGSAGFGSASPFPQAGGGAGFSERQPVPGVYREHQGSGNGPDAYRRSRP